MARTGNFHRTNFDEGTNTKLELFRMYLRSWLPVFISSSPRGSTINIVDLFAGPGTDQAGNPGSPLIALEEIQNYSRQIATSGVKIRLILNDRAARKARALEARLLATVMPGSCSWSVDNLDAGAAFTKHHDLMTPGPNLMFLDQFGMTFITEAMFHTLISLRKTDLLFFISSSHLRRFADHPAIKNRIVIPHRALRAATFEDTHRAVAEYYKSLVPQASEYYIGSFSIKKGSNLYGLIFGSGHPLGIEKFLQVCWKIAPNSGEANFDIDHDGISAEAPRLFADMDRPRKLDVFRQRLRDEVLSAKLKTDRAVYLFALQNGVPPAEAKTVLRELRREARIAPAVAGTQFRVSKDGYKDPRAIEVLGRGNQ